MEKTADKFKQEVLEVLETKIQHAKIGVGANMMKGGLLLAGVFQEIEAHLTALKNTVAAMSVEEDAGKDKPQN